MCCRDADKVSRRVADVLKDVASLEILQAPGLSFIVPDQFASQPRLTGEQFPSKGMQSCVRRLPLLQYSGMTASLHIAPSSAVTQVCQSHGVLDSSFCSPWHTTASLSSRASGTMVAMCA